MRPREQGFTILELMIVVVILAIVAAMALPGLAQAKQSANEAAAIESLRSIATVMEQHRTRFGGYPMRWDVIRSHGYLAGFDGEVRADFEGAPNVGGKSGYSFEISSDVSFPWRVAAVPNEPGVTGSRYFYIDSGGVIRQNIDPVDGG